jgi:outer membrane protein assembly factor BamB
VVDGHLYLLGNQGLDKEYVQALSAKDGRPLWTTPIGKVGNPDQKPNYPAARSTPTVVGNRLYALGSDGDLVCLETESGKLTWRKNLRSDFGGKPGTWAYSESPLVDGDLVICTPGGAEATIVALNKNTGEVVWKCAATEGDEAAYASPMKLEAAGAKQYVQMLQQGLVGVDAKTGKLLWRYGKTVSQYRANIPTPVVRDDLVFSAGAGTGAGLVRVVPRDGAIALEQVYFSSKLPTAIGGAVLVGDHLYGTTAQAMLCVEFKTGTVKWEERALGAASLCFADGRLYLQGENGEVALVDPSPEGYRETGRFRPPARPERLNQMEKTWTYPVVCEGRLYLRDHELLWCYDISAPR